MIPAQNIVAWAMSFPGPRRQVEQDLIISRALVEIFSDAMLRDELRLRVAGAMMRGCLSCSTRLVQDRAPAGDGNER